MKFGFEISEMTPSNNEMLRKYKNPMARARARDKWAWLVKAAWGREFKRIDRCRVRVTRFGRNYLDWDNMGGGLKFLLDGMVHAGVLKDDKPAVIEALDLAQEIDRHRPRTRVEIWTPDE